MKKRWISVLMAVILVFTMATPLVSAEPKKSEMTVSEDLIRILKKMEGFQAKPIWDYSQWTVGYGTECPADKLEEYKKNGITEADAVALLNKELDRFETAVNNFANTHNLVFKQHQFDALVSFSYNLGESWMRDTAGYFNTAVREQGTIDELIYGIVLYSMAGGEYMLMERRLCEADMYINGEYRAYNSSTEGTSAYMKYVFLDGNGGDIQRMVYGYDARRGSQISVSFSRIPTGVDEKGNPFAYTLAGWYTADGKKVEKLDSTLKNGQILYARWADPTGKVVSIPKGTPEEMTVTVTADSLNVRTGPATHYSRVGSYEKGTAVPITEIYQTGDYTWGKSTLGWFRLDNTNYAELKSAQSQFPKEGTVTDNNVNVRTGPGTKHNAVAQKHKGDRVIISEEAEGGSLRWGKLADGNWICLDYVRYDEDAKVISTVTLLQPPSRTEYVQKMESLHLEGCVLLITYTDGSTTALTPTRSMVSSYSNATLGETTVQLTYEGKPVSFKVTIIKATVTFLDYDGTVLSTAQYAYGETVKVPPAPTREGTGGYFYMFSGWDRAVTTCAGNAVYTATYVESTDPDAVVVPQSITSGVYTAADGYIRKIAAGTTVETLVSGINESSYIAVYNGETPVTGAAVVTTGMTVRLEHGGKVIQSLTLVVTGDVNGDGGVSITDALQIKSHLLQKQTLSGANALAADTSADGAVSITDFLQVKAKILGKGEIAP